MTAAPAAPAPSPTPLTASDLAALARAAADEVRAGTHAVRFDAEERWAVRLRGDARTDVWLISWTRDQSTELHDHAGSLGALTVVQGSLTERYWTGGAGLSTRTLETGDGAEFPLGHVHDVVNAEEEPAVSVHAYSPPLTAMHYYEEESPGALRRTRSILTGVPEPDARTLDSIPSGPAAEPAPVHA